jgi:hypothetical protein
MTRPLRRAHQSIWLALAVALPTLMAASLALRPFQATDERIADRITFRLPNGTEMIADSRDLWGSPVDEPDPLIYWAAEAGGGAGRGPEGPPRGARLVGALARGRQAALVLPASGGYLLLYSLAHREVLASAPAPKEIP